MPDASSGPDAPPSAKHSPRALSRGAGYVLQTVGFILLFGGCCIGPVIGYVQGEQDVAPANVAEWFRYSPTGQLLTAINIIVAGLAGLGLVVFGLGLHQERTGSGAGAMVTTGVLMLTWWATAIAAILFAPSILRIAFNLLLAVAATFLFLLAGAARRELQLHPPPPDEPVTEEFLKQFERRRHRAEEDDPPDRGFPINSR